jgi:hypothetical protein
LLPDRKILGRNGKPSEFEHIPAGLCYLSDLSPSDLTDNHLLFAFNRSDDFKETPNRLALLAMVDGARFICFATASSEFEDAATCIKCRSSANDQWRFVEAAIYFEPFTFGPSPTRYF